MPTYEYVCEACKHEFEQEQRITADKLKKCPECGELKLKRLIGTGNFILKGGGWYADLYHKPASGGGSDSGRSASSAPKSEGPKSEGPKSEGPKSEGPKGPKSEGPSKKAD